MIQLFKNLSIQTKLTVIMMLSSMVLLVIIGGIVLVAEIYTTRAVQVQELRILANSLSANSRQALVLGKKTEVETLLASLIYQKNIRAAYFFDRKGTPVAEYLNQQGSQFILPALQSDFRKEHRLFWTDALIEHQLFSFDHFSLFSPVFYAEKHIGTLYLLSDMNRLYGHLSGVAFGITLALLLMFFLSWLLAGYLQKPVSAPLLQLADLMGEVSESQDYSVRAVKVSHDEIGTLVDGFNRMLSQVELHQANLAEHQMFLEQTVAERTAELRTAVKELELAREQADAANEAKSHFLSRMTHELRTPLIGVLGMNELLARTSLSDQQCELVDTVQKSGEQLLHLISDVLDFSRIEAGKLQLELNRFELVQTVRDVVALLALQAQRKGLKLLLDVPGHGWTVEADETRIRQILMNLIGNAIKFTSTGAITVSVKCSQQKDNSGTCIFEVADTGIGMTEETQQQIFDVFYQQEDLQSGADGGTGLGLTIVKQLVDLMGGELNLYSTPGQGSRFQVVVDLAFVEKTRSGEGVGQ